MLLGARLAGVATHDRRIKTAPFLLAPFSVGPFRQSDLGRFHLWMHNGLRQLLNLFGVFG